MNLWDRLFRKERKVRMQKYTNISKYSNPSDARAAFLKMCDAKGVYPSQENFNIWAWQTAPECIEYRPYTRDEALAKTLGRWITNGPTVSLVNEVDGGVDNKPLTINGIDAAELLQFWRFYGTDEKCGVVKDA